jgi:hypothetical protein
LKIGFLGYNLLHLIRLFYVQSENARRSIDWIVLQLVMAGDRIVHHAWERVQPKVSKDGQYRWSRTGFWPIKAFPEAEALPSSLKPCATSLLGVTHYRRNL